MNILKGIGLVVIALLLIYVSFAYRMWLCEGSAHHTMCVLSK